MLNSVSVGASAAVARRTVILGDFIVVRFLLELDQWSHRY